MSEDDGNRDDPLTPMQIEEAEMVHELKRLGMYEEGATYDHMKSILGFINESKSMAAENRASQEIGEYSPEMVSMESAVQADPPWHETRKEVPKPSFSYRQAMDHNLPGSHDQRSSQESIVDEDSDLLGDIIDKTRSQKKRFQLPSTNNDSAFDRLVEENNVKEDPTNQGGSRPASRNSLVIVSDNSQRSQNMEVEADVQTKRNWKAEMWRLNPLEVSLEDNDVSLRQPQRPMLQERGPFIFCHHQRALETQHKMMTVLGNHLEEVAEKWLSKHRREDTEMQWGSPIQVGTAKGSLDKKPLSESKCNPANFESHEGEYHERASKRKANYLINHMTDDDEEDLEVKKSKKYMRTQNIPNKLSIATGEKTLTRAEKILRSVKNMPKQESFECNLVNSDIENDLDDYNTVIPKNVRKKKEQAAPDFFPRRIPPPNPKRRPGTSQTRGRGRGGRGGRKKEAKPKDRGPRKSQLSDSDDEFEAFPSPIKSSTSGKGRSTRISDTEITEELEMEDVVVNEDKEVVIKPLPMVLHGARPVLRSSLKDTKESEENARRSLTRAATQRDRERREQRRHEEVEEGTEAKEDERVSQELDEVEILHDTHQSPFKEAGVACPICFKMFSKEDIEDHAGQCEPYDSPANSLPASRQSQDPNFFDTEKKLKLKLCNICSTFSTEDDTKYENHVHYCIINKKDELAERVPSGM